MSTLDTLEKPANGRRDKDTSAEKAASAADAPVSAEMSVEQSKQEMTTPEGVERTRTGRVFSPAVDIYETNDAVVLVADMPGVDEKSVDVTLEKNVLTIYGRVEEVSPAGLTPIYSEYRIGDYQRAFTISNAINWEGIEGKVRNGVLHLTLPKAGPAQTRKISIASA